MSLERVEIVLVIYIFYSNGPWNITSNSIFIILFNLFFFFLQNLEAEKQLKFFQGCVAAAFAERDTSMMEVKIAMFHVWVIS